LFLARAKNDLSSSSVATPERAMGYTQGPLTWRMALALSLSILSIYWFMAKSQTAKSSFTTTLSPPSAWKYEFPRDANNYGLSSDQCDAAFPGFYGDIESAVASRKRDPVRLEELEIKDNQCLVRVLIYNSEVRTNSIDELLSQFPNRGRSFS
jgi:hypothetical protein